MITTTIDRKERKDVSVQCIRCGKIYNLSVNPTDWAEYCFDPERRHVQDIFPYLSPDWREMLISGTCPECWKEIYACLEDEDMP